MIVDQRQGGAGNAPPPLIPPFAQAAAGDDDDDDGRGRSPLGSLRASARAVDLVGRDDVLAIAKAWREEPPSGGGPDHRALTIFGPGGAGKTRLGGEILQAAIDLGWEAGFVSESIRSYPHRTALTYPEKPTMIAVDYAEARYHDLKLLLEESAAGGDAPFRLILIVREGIAQPGEWLRRLEGDGDLGPRAESLLEESQLTAISLEESLPEVADRDELWRSAAAGWGNGAASAPAYLADSLFERPLLVMLDAHRVDAGAEGDGAEAPSEADLFESVLKHERNYWASAAEEIGLKVSKRRMNQVAAVATLVGGVARTAFESALRALDGLGDDEDLLLQTCDWWCSIYATGRGAIRGVEPDIVGEYLVMRALGPREDPNSTLDGSLQVDKLRSLIGLATPAGRQRLLRVLTRIAAGGAGEGAESARAVLAELLDLHLQDFLPATFSQAAAGLDRTDPDESLAMTVASAVLACDRLQLMSGAPAGAEVGDGAEEVSPAAVRTTALGMVRRQIESVARRELEAGRWSADRFADVMTWVLRFDLQAGEHSRARRELERIERLDPRPNLALVAMRREIGRDHVAAFRGREARAMFEAALDDLEAAGERDSALGYVVLSELGDAVQHSDSFAAAVEIHKRAFEGLRKADGPAAESTVAALSSLVYCLGADNLEAALTYRDEALEQLQAEDADEELLQRVRGTAVGAKLAAGRTAVVDGDRERGRELLNDALRELDENDERESLHAQVIVETLAAAAANEGDRERAAELYEEALEGKRKLRDGYDHPGTIGTLLELASNLAHVDVRRAAAVLDGVATELRAAGAESCDNVVNAHAGVLTRAGLIDEGLEAIRRHHEETLARDVRSAVFETIADPTPLEVVPPFAVAADATVLAVEIFAVEDPRFVALASRLAVLSLERATAALGVHISAATLAALAAGSNTVREDLRALAGALQLPKLRENAPVVARALAAAEQSVREALRELRADPAVADAGIGRQEGGARPIEVGEVRRWLIRCGLDGPEAHGLETAAIAVGGILSWSLNPSPDEAGIAPVMSGSTDGIWRGGGPDDTRLAAERERLQGELEAIPAVADEAAALVDMGQASALLCGARAAMDAAESDAAEQLCRAAAEALEAVGRADSGLAWAAHEQLAEIAAARGDIDRAISCAEVALQGWRDLGDDGVAPSMITAVLRIAGYRARRNLDEALAGVDVAIEELEARDDAALVVSQLRRGRATIMRAAGERAVAGDDLERAEELYEAARREIAEMNEGDTALAFNLLGDIGGVALRRGDRERGIDLLEQTVEGQRRLLGPADPTTQSTVAELARAINAERPAAALSLVDAALEECLGKGAEGKNLRTLRLSRVACCRELGRLEVGNGRHDRARELLEGALDEFDGIDGHDAAFAYVIVHDLGDLAVAEQQFDAARDLYRRAFEGKRRLRGLAHRDTLVSAATYAECLGLADKEEALDLLDRLLREASAEDLRAEDLRPLEITRASLYRLAGERAVSRGDLSNAEREFLQGLELLERIDQGESELRYTLVGRRGDVARASGDLERAAELHSEAYEGLRRGLGPSHEAISGALVALVYTALKRDFDLAIETIAERLAELVDSGADADQISRIREGFAGMFVTRARAASSAGDHEHADLCLRHAHAELVAAGQGESRASYVLLHDMAELARKRGEDSAPELFEKSFEGKRRLLGLADRETLVTLSSLAELQARADYAGAAERLERAREELSAEGADPEAIAIVRDTLSRVHLLGGRQAENADDLDEAERRYRRALGEAPQLDRGEGPDLTHILTHDLANVAAKRMDSDRALELYREAHAGTRRLRGLADPETIGTLVSLTDELARSDLPAAIDLLDQALAELAEEEDAEELVESLREGQATAHLHAGRAAEGAGLLDRAEELYRAVLENLERRGRRDSLLAYVALHDLGDIAVARVALDRAIVSYREAFEGKRRLSGLADPDTLVTYRELVEGLAIEDPEAGLDLTGEVLEHLEREDAEEFAIRSARIARAIALLGVGNRIERDGDLERALELYEQGHEAMQSAGADSDPIAVECLMRRILALNDGNPRAALELVERSIGELGADAGAELRTMLHTARVGSLVGVGRELVAEDPDQAEQYFLEGLSELDALGIGDSEAAFSLNFELGGVAMDRDQAERAVEFFERAAVGNRRTLGLADAATLMSVVALADALIPVDLGRAEALLDGTITELGELGFAADEFPRLLRGRAAVLMYRGREATHEARWDEAEEVLRRAVDEVAAIGEDVDHRLIAVITHDRGDVAMARHEFERAAGFYTEAFEGKRGETGLAVADTLVSLLSLAFARSSDDLSAALSLIDNARTELEEADADDDLIRLLHENRIAVHLHAGRVAEIVAEDLDEAERLYRAVLEQTEASGDRHSSLAYAALHDLGDVTLARENNRKAVPLLEEALRGRRRLAGAGDPETVTTLLRLADALLGQDPAAAFTMLEGAVEELREEGNEGAIARIEGWFEDQRPDESDDG